MVHSQHLCWDPLALNPSWACLALPFATQVGIKTDGVTSDAARAVRIIRLVRVVSVLELMGWRYKQVGAGPGRITVGVHFVWSADRFSSPLSCPRWAHPLPRPRCVFSLPNPRRA